MTKTRRRKKPKPKEEPKRVKQIAVASSKDGPVLYALTEEGEIYEYGVVQDDDLGAEVGMWEQLSTIESRNIVDDAEVEEDDDA